MLSKNINEEFKRDTWCLLGLPFDAVSMEDTVNILYESIIKKKKIFLSTPNLNFLIASQNDSKFRDSVVNSNLSVVDGKPIVWVARLLKIPIFERVAGSDLIEELNRSSDLRGKINIFFFGGEEGIAEIACNSINKTSTGLNCVGNSYPGFGTIENMSDKQTIHMINQSDADFIIVSLGAKKGQAWIERNRQLLNAPIISHLGAVVNFMAGKLVRSPKLIQRIGFEWLWRIKEEPQLWRRYYHDAVSFSRLLIFKILPLIFIVRIREKAYKKYSPTINIDTAPDKILIKMGGYWNNDNIHDLSTAFISILSNNNDCNVDIIIKNNSYINSSVIAKMVLLKRMLSDSNRKLIVTTDSKLIRNIINYHCCTYLLDE